MNLFVTKNHLHNPLLGSHNFFFHQFFCKSWHSAKQSYQDAGKNQDQMNTNSTCNGRCAISNNFFDNFLVKCQLKNPQNRDVYIQIRMFPCIQPIPQLWKLLQKRIICKWNMIGAVASRMVSRSSQPQSFFYVFPSSEETSF